jgi:hypothetical protein
MRRVAVAGLLPLLLVTGCGVGGTKPASAAKRARVVKQPQLLQLEDVRGILVLPKGFKPTKDDSGESQSDVCGPGKENGFDVSTWPSKAEVNGEVGETGPFNYQALAVLPTEARARQIAAGFATMAPCSFKDKDGTTRTLTRRADGEYSLSVVSIFPVAGLLSVRTVGNVLYLSYDVAVGAAPPVDEHEARTNGVVAALKRRIT